MKILYATSEAQPFAASGGLADVAGSLPKALVEEGQECIVVMPYYVNTIKDSQKEHIRYIILLIYILLYSSVSSPLYHLSDLLHVSIVCLLPLLFPEFSLSPQTSCLLSPA